MVPTGTLFSLLCAVPVLEPAQSPSSSRDAPRRDGDYFDPFNDSTRTGVAQQNTPASCPRGLPACSVRCTAGSLSRSNAPRTDDRCSVVARSLKARQAWLRKICILKLQTSRNAANPVLARVDRKGSS
ncbi:uncharacterized protein KRP23_4304 [Phytophthora ramorum]|uniref:uncharacterized protein n=1 Tax=Phytophthora ramorum TaxID=164328 RepID=UPI003096328E|nr:hypothetical protein KRP23_4304 [Phytophthora ramorum]